MKIALLSDIHGFLPKIDKNSIDCVLIAGDICPDFRKIKYQGTWLNFAFLPWSRQFNEVKWIGGNHDFFLEENGISDDNYLMNSFATLSNGMVVYGFPYTICEGWAFHQRDDQIAYKLNLEKKADILMCHNPPYQIGDRLGPYNRHADHHIGSMSIRQYIETMKPEYVLFGHIHEGYGMYQLGKTLCINCAFCDEKRIVRNQYLLLDTDTNKVDIVPCEEYKYNEM